MATLGKYNGNLLITVCAVYPREWQSDPKLSFRKSCLINCMRWSLGVLYSKNSPGSSEKDNCEQTCLSGGTICLLLPGLAFLMTFSDCILFRFVPVSGMCTSTIMVVPSLANGFSQSVSAIVVTGCNLFLTVSLWFQICYDSDCFLISTSV